MRIAELRLNLFFSFYQHGSTLVLYFFTVLATFPHITRRRRADEHSEPFLFLTPQSVLTLTSDVLLFDSLDC